MPQYYDTQNRIVSTEDQLARGGEGTIFTVQGNQHQVAKIWASPDHNRVEKLDATVRNTPPRNPGSTSAPFTWPQERLQDRTDRTVGYLMPKLDTTAFTGVVAYYNRSLRTRTEAQYKVRIDQRLLVAAASNLAKAIGTIHDAGHVIGDVNENNMMMNAHGDVVIVDIDSIQIHDRQSGKIHPCQVGREDYTPPRLQGSNFRQEIRTKDDDCFGLAVLIFKLLMGGMHPFSSVVGPNDQGAIAELGQKIKQQLFPYNEDSTVPNKYKVAAPEYKSSWANARDEIKTLFREAFDPFYIKNNPRPDAKRWAQALERQLEMEKQKGRTVNQSTGPPRVSITQGEKEKNQAQVQYAINRLLDDLKPLTLEYSQQGVRDNVWSLNDLQKKAGSVSNIRSLHYIRGTTDVLALLHILTSITEKLDCNWTQQWNLQPKQIQEVVHVRNDVHNLQKFADVNHTTRALKIINDFHNGIRAAPRTWPKEAVWKPGQNRPIRNPRSPRHGNKPNTGPPPTTASSQQAPTGPDWDEWIAKIFGFIREYPLTIPLIFVGILIIWFAPRLSEMEEKGTYTLVTVGGAPFSAWLCKRLNLSKFIRQTAGLAKRTWNTSSQTNDPAVRTATRSAIVVVGLILLAIPLATGIFLATPPGNHSSEGNNQQVQISAETSVATATAPSDTESSTATTGAETSDVTHPDPTPTLMPTLAITHTPESPFKSYTHSDWNLTFLYPQGWIPSQELGLITFLAPEDKGFITMTPHTSARESSLQDFLEWYKTDNEQAPPHATWTLYQEIETLTGTNGDHEFIEIRFEGQINSGGCIQNGVTRLFKSKYFGDLTIRTFSFTITECEHDLEEFKKTRDQILNSLKEENYDWDLQIELQRRDEERHSIELQTPTPQP